MNYKVGVTWRRLLQLERVPVPPPVITTARFTTYIYIVKLFQGPIPPSGMYSLRRDELVG
ncbi:hypothetical protein E2C01_056265 [Portunus trituberculatus]|uniref:Uncharacterized protein n=1 Tax=Portunus trituberculatus TaxID=210409 RepID=A0A5B7GTM2_PORTR|nr:hypothetical protein [Portunus trituberculatus]